RLKKPKAPVRDRVALPGASSFQPVDSLPGTVKLKAPYRPAAHPGRGRDAVARTIGESSDEYCPRRPGRNQELLRGLRPDLRQEGQEARRAEDGTEGREYPGGAEAGRNQKVSRPGPCRRGGPTAPSAPVACSAAPRR